MNFTNLKFSFGILQFLKEYFLFDFFILIVMVLQCVVVKSYTFTFQLHYKKKVHNHNFFKIVWTRDIGCTIFCEVHLGLNIYPFSIKNFVFERLKYTFNFSFYFCQVSQINFAYNAIILD